MQMQIVETLAPLATLFGALGNVLLLVVLLLALWLATAFSAGRIASEKGRSFTLYLVFGLALPPVALVEALLLKPTPRAAIRRWHDAGWHICRTCTGPLSPAAHVCPHCGADRPVRPA